MPELEELKRTGIQRGQRNAVLYRLACQLYRRLPTAAGWAELVAVWQAGDTTGMTESELRVIADSARRFIAAQVSREAAVAERAAEWLNRR